MNLMRTITLVAALCVALCVASCTLAGDYSPSVCRVQVADGSAGSGALVAVGGRNFVFTNVHVVGGFGQATVRWPSGGVYVRLPVLYRDRAGDIAILDARIVRSIPAVRLARAELRSGRATAYGFGDGQFASVAGQWWYQQGETYGGGVPTVHLGGVNRYGDSGGPVISDDGALVAMMWGTDFKTHTACVPLQRLHQAVRRVLGTQGCYGGQCPPRRQLSPVPRMQPRQQLPPPPGGYAQNPDAGQPPATPNDASSMDCERCEERLSQLEKKVGGMSEDIASLNKRPDYSDRLKAIDAKLAGMDYGDRIDKLEGLGDRIDSLEESTGKLASNLVQVVSVSADLQARVEKGDADLKARLAALEQDMAGLAEASKSPAGGARHYTLVAESDADYWPRLREEYQSAARAYQGFRVAEPPPFEAGELPRLVAWDDSTPIGSVGGVRSVSVALAQISRGDTPQFLGEW